MSDPMADFRDRTGTLDLALAQWTDGGAAQDKAAARTAASTVVDAIDALLRDLFVLRGASSRRSARATMPRVAEPPEQPGMTGRWPSRSGALPHRIRHSITPIPARPPQLAGNG